MREMKDGGVQWIGEIPEKWAIVSTKFLFTIISGATPESAKSENWDGNIRWITPADYKTKDVYVAVGRRNLTQMGFDSCSTNMVPTGSIIFSKRAPIGSVAINSADLCTNQGCLSCINKGTSFVKFYYYVMSIPSFNKDTHAFRQRKSALTASSRRRGLRFMSGRYSYGIGTPPTLRRSASPHEVLRPCGDPAAAYASMPASSSLSSSGFLSPKSPAEFLRGRNGARGSAER